MSNKELCKLVKDYSEFKSLEKEIKGTLDMLKKQIEEVLNENEVDRMKIGDFTVSKSVCNRTDIDKEGLKANYPEILAEFTRFSTYIRLTVK